MTNKVLLKKNMSEENKKNVLDNLSKEDLIKKCQALIVIAQKAKKSKEKLEEENNELKKKISDDAIKEILDEKLIPTSKLGNIELKNIALEDKLKFYEKKCEYNQEKLDISEAENISSKRQLKKLTDENEHLITELSDLEGQINQLNNLIKLQQEQLLQWRETKGSSFKDLQNKEFKSFKEVEKLGRCSQTIEIGINNLTEDLRSVNMIHTRPVRGTNQNIDIHVSEISELKKKNETFSREVLCLQSLNEKLKQKVKFYHSKLKMFALTIKEIKKEKNQVLQIFKAYTEQIVDWKKQLFSANKELLKLGSDIENKNSSLKNQKRELTFGNNLADFEQVNIENITKVDCDHFLQKITDKHNFETYSFKDKLLMYKKNLDILKRNIIISKKESEVDAFHKEKVEDTDTLDLTTSRVGALEVKQNYIEGNINSKNKLVTNKDKINELKFMPEETSLKQEIESLTENNRELLDNNYKIKQKLELKNRSFKNCFTQTENCLTITQNNINLKYENSKLLQDMNQMNKALKQCEEIISQPDAHCNKLERRLHLSKTKSNGNVNDVIEKTETDKQIESLEVKQGYKDNKQLSDADSNIVAYFKTEADILTEKYMESAETNYAKSDTMSFSTISIYEVNRMKDLDGSLEERYIKLCAFAFKLKGKLQEQGINIIQLQTEKEELQIKLTNTSKTVHCLQNQIDKLQDNLDKVSIENKLYSSKLNSLAENMSKDKQSLVEHEDTSIQLKKNDILSREKQGIENWKKQLSAKVKILRKELESKNLLIKEYESKIFKSETDSMNNDKEIKKNLSLGMQDYEKSIEGLYKIIETKNDVTSLETQSGMQKSALDAISYHNNLYEKSKQTEKNKQNAALVEITALKKYISDLEEIVHHKDAKILGLLMQVETTKSQNDELSAELLRVISEHKKSLNLIISERDQERNQILCLQHSLRHTQDVLKLKEEELLVLKKEYETHRVRAQSVLEKKLGDHGLKEKLLEELFTLKSRDSQLNNDINELREKLNQCYCDAEIVRNEKNEYMETCNGLEKQNEELKNFSEGLSLKYQEAINEHAQTFRCLKVKGEMLTQCFRRQLSEQELRYNKEMMELQSRLNKCRSPIDTTHVYPNILRGEGEGLESKERTAPSNNVLPTSLEKLLDSKLDDEVIYLKKQLFEQESRTAHLTALLSDTEQDYAKHVQMNKLLKEEIRRQQRSTEREKQAENLEYLKNIIFKFLTLKNSDERTRLVPVLNTILKLSPEETNELILVAKGDPVRKGWNSYLTIWTSPNKPQ